MLVTLSFYPIMRINYQMINFIPFVSYVQLVQSFTLGLVELTIKFMNSLIHACLLLVHILKFTLTVCSLIFFFAQWDLAFLWFGEMLILILLSFFGIKITHLNTYFIIFHVFYVMQIVIQHKVRTNLMIIQLWLLISFL